MFEQKRCLSNIYYLARLQKKRIGDIEKAAGVSTGYISRLNREDNTSVPSVEFLEGVANVFGVTLDALINYDLSELTPTEQYIMTFLEKLTSDTQADKLNWEKESANSLNRLTFYNGYTGHPLFSKETFYRQSECEYPDEVTEVVFVSDSFGPNTRIAGDCFKLKMKNDSVLYVMNICKDVYRTTDPNSHAKEIWINVPQNGGAQFVAKNTIDDNIGNLIDILYQTISEDMKHPKVAPGVRHIIDAFMENDLENDNDYVPEDILPFS